jgi:hypothetical protein
MQRDIEEVQFWQYADPVPFIIPPLINKEMFLSLDYSRVVMSRVFEALAKADVIISFGFSIPRSDLHINALFDLAKDASATEGRKKIGLIYKAGAEDHTLANWTRIFGSKHRTEEIANNGLDTSSADAIDNVWEDIFDIIRQ